MDVSTGFVITGNWFKNISGHGMNLGGGIRLYGGSHTTSVVINNNTIISPAPNSWLICNAATGGTLNGRENWFGSAVEDDFKDEIGGAIDNNVDYSGWLTF